MAYNYFEKSPVEAAQAIEKKSQGAPLNDGLVGDAVDSFQAGALSGMGGMFDFVGAEGIAKSLYAWSDDQQKTMSESGRESLSKQFITEDANGDIAIGEGMKDIDTWILTMANVAGQFAGTAVPGGAAARAVTKVANLGSKGGKAAGAIGMGATGGSAATGQGMEQARQEIQNMPDEILADSPMFVGVLKDIHSKNPSLSGAEKWDLAKDEIASRVAQDVRTDPKVLVANFAASAIGDPIIGKALTGARIAKSGALKSALAGTVTEGTTESIQAGAQQYGINEALQPIDNRDSMKGVVAAGLNEGIAGGAFGGAAGAIGGIANRRAESFKEKSEQVVKDGYEQMVEAGISPEEAMDKIKSQQYEAAIKKGFNEQEAQEIVSKTVRDQFGIDDGVTNEARQVEQAQTIPEDTETPVFKNDDIDYDSPTAARQAGFDQTVKAAGQYGDMLTSPAQQSLRDLEAGNNAPTVDERVKAAAFDKSPTPEDRFSPIKYQHEGELIRAEAPSAPGIENAPIDGQTIPEQGKLPTTEQTENRQAREQAQADLEAQPKGIEQKDIIFGEDGRPQQRAAERVKQAGKDSQNLLPQKDIVFAGNESGVNVAKSGEPFKTKRDALLSKEARAARRAGQKTKAVSFDNGFGWTIKGDDGTKQDSEQAAAEQSPESDTVAQNEQGDQAQPAQQEGEALSLNVDAEKVNSEENKNIAGEMIDDEWQSFTKESGTKNIPRSEMPQIKAENRGAMVNFMKARDISHEQDEVAAGSLKPTQQEFSPAKVKKAMEFEGGNRSILVSNDGYVLDGHHQWLAAREKGEPVKVIRLNAPIEQLVPLAKEMPSTETQDNNGKLTTTGNEELATTGKLNSNNGKQSEQKGVETAETGKLTEQEPATTDQQAELPPILKTTKRKWLQSEAKKQGLKKGSPGFDVAMAKIEEGYEPAIDKALAESSFETYQEFNSDTPESINRQAYSELRKEFGFTDALQAETAAEPKSTEKTNDPEIPDSSNQPTKKIEPPKSGFSLPEPKNTDGMTIDDIEASISNAKNDLATTNTENWGGFKRARQKVWRHGFRWYA